MPSLTHCSITNPRMVGTRQQAPRGAPCGGARATKGWLFQGQGLAVAPCFRSRAWQQPHVLEPLVKVPHSNGHRPAIGNVLQLA